MTSILLDVVMLMILQHTFLPVSSIWSKRGWSCWNNSVMYQLKRIQTTVYHIIFHNLSGAFYCYTCTTVAIWVLWLGDISESHSSILSFMRSLMSTNENGRNKPTYTNSPCESIKEVIQSLETTWLVARYIQNVRIYNKIHGCFGIVLATN